MIKLLCLGVGTYETVEVTGLVFMRVTYKYAEIGDAIICCAGCEPIMKGQGVYGGISTC